MKYWLMKTEPDTFSIQDLYNSKNHTTSWEGVRNYQARNFMRDQMKKGDLILIYHSSCKTPGIVGLASVTQESHPDRTALDPNSNYYDPKATAENPRWYLVDVKWKETFNKTISLKTLKANLKLQEMKLVQKGCRLSVMPVTKNEFNLILEMSKKD